MFFKLGNVTRAAKKNHMKAIRHMWRMYKNIPESHDTHFVNDVEFAGSIEV